jgi:hypothetical protein
MRSPAAERSLRRLVAQLATAEPEDVQQVLEALDFAQQSEVRALLDAYDAPAVVAMAPAPKPPPPPPPVPVPVPVDTSHLAGLSSWLAERVAAADGGDSSARMTPGAMSALAHAARSIPADAGLSLEAAPARRRSFNPVRRPGAASWG